MRTEFIRSVVLALIGTAALGLSACDNGPSAVETRERAGGVAEGTLALATGATPAEAATVTPVAEKTVLTANRRETVDAKIARLYERNGSDFGARSPEDFLVKVQTFTTSPPAGTEMVKRPNGDTLYYQSATNTFAVVSRDGVPRTMFKPDDGPTYWAEQKDRAPTFGQRRQAE